MSLGKMHAYCYGPYVHLIEFVTSQAKCQMGSVPSGKKGNVWYLPVFTNFTGNRKPRVGCWKISIQENQANKQTI